MKPTLDEFYATLRYDEETDKFVSPTGEVFDGLQQARNAFHRDGMTVDQRLHWCPRKRSERVISACEQAVE